MAPRFLAPLLVCAAWASAAAPVLPHAGIDASQISISGLSSGADFAAQFQVAYSGLVMGSGVFAGQAFRCAVTRFKGDKLTPPNPSVPICDGCPANSTLQYDHCKKHPEWVEPKVLVNFAREAAGRGEIDGVGNMSTARVYLYHGEYDKVYLNGSIAKVRDFFAEFLADPDEQILFNHTTPSAHSWPTADYGEKCGDGVIENCGYDGAGACLNHIYGALPNAPAEKFKTESLHEFDQRPFGGSDPNATGLNATGFVYIPKSCEQPDAKCKLHISLHGCNVNYYYDDAVMHLSFNRWAETNGIVVLWPRVANHGVIKQEAMGCWDTYAQTGPNYAYKSGAQMVAVRDMIRTLSGV